MIFMLDALDVLANRNADKLHPPILSRIVSPRMEVEAFAPHRGKKLPKYV